MSTKEIESLKRYILDNELHLDGRCVVECEGLWKRIEEILDAGE